jgi:Na+-transporting methylmalonyl-CoA/oxaloacetate decarboxylase gamma subunit
VINPLLIQISRINEGYLILISGLVIVFGALLLLSLFFKYGLPALLFVYRVIIKGPDKKIKDIQIDSDRKFTGEEAAAIAAAVHLYLNEQHDVENPILTIRQAKKSYSPWSSKIYSTYSQIR